LPIPAGILAIEQANILPGILPASGAIEEFSLFLPLWFLFPAAQEQFTFWLGRGGLMNGGWISLKCIAG
jgi:hypothetical protein